MGTPIISFTIPGIPSGKPRPRRVRTRGGGGFHTYTPRAKSQDALELAILRARPKKPITGPVKLTIDAFFSKDNPRMEVTIEELSPGGWHLGRPDIDNIQKLVMDLCQWKKDGSGGDIYLNDKQVVWVEVKKGE